MCLLFGLLRSTVMASPEGLSRYVRVLFSVLCVCVGCCVGVLWYFFHFFSSSVLSSWFFSASRIFIFIL